MLLLQSFTLPTTRRCLSSVVADPGEGPGGGPPPVFLDKTEALRDGKNLFETLRPLI